MATGTAERESTTGITCFFHQQEIIRLFCTKCESAICLTCLLDKHNQHPIQSISNVQQFISQKVAEWYSDEKDSKDKLRKRKSLLYAKIEETEACQLKTEKEIQNCQKIWRKKIETGSNQMIYDAKQISSKNVEHLQSIVHDLEECEIDLQNSNKQIDTLNLYYNLRMCMDPRDKNLFTHANPILIRKMPGEDFGTGTICVGENSYGKCSLEMFNNLDVGQASVCTSVDKEVQTHFEADLFSSSDDVVIPEPASFVKKTIPLSSSLQPVTKILPISLNDAWLLANRRLHKLEQNKIINSTYTEEIDDFVILENGQFLVLNKEHSMIVRILETGEAIPFTSTGSNMPLCMALSEDNKNVIVFVGQYERGSFYTFDLNGIYVKIESLDYKLSDASYLAVPCKNNYQLVVSCKKNDALRNTVISYTTVPKTCRTFQGKIGYSTYDQFVCNGMCHESNGYVLVSDYMFHKVYLLDSSLNFKKILLDFETGIENPTSLALKDGYLWVANTDSQEIVIYNYGDIK